MSSFLFAGSAFVSTDGMDYFRLQLTQLDNLIAKGEI